MPSSSEVKDFWRGLSSPSAAVPILLLLLAAVAWDVTYSRVLDARARASVQDRLAGHAFALQSGMAERAVLVEGLRAWTRTSIDLSAEEFGDVARSLLMASPGIQALQVVRGGRIALTYPIEGNEAVIGYDLRAHPDPEVRDGLLRAWAHERVTLTGPVELIQGGLGLILRRSAGAGGDTDADVAAIVLDVGVLLEEAGLDGLEDDGLGVTARRASGEVFYGRSADGAEAPEAVDVELPEGAWVLTAAPLGGWSALYSGEIAVSRLASGVAVLLASLLLVVLVTESRRLAAAVEARTGELRVREEQLSAALVAGRVSTWDWNVRTGEVRRSASAEALLGSGMRTEGSLGDFEALVHPDDHAGFKESLAKAKQTGHFAAEYRILDAQGEHIWVREVGSPVAYDEQGPVRLTGATADITWAKQLEERVLRDQRTDLIGRLAGGVAHNFNNLLTVIVAELQLALGGLPEGDARTSVEEALASAERTAILTRQLLTFSERDAVRPESLPFDEVCGEAVALVRRAAKGDVVVEQDLSSDGARVHIDRARAIQVVADVALNAIDAMPHGGTLKVRTRRSATTSAAGPATVPRVVLEISDTGTGISPEALGRVFDPFFTTKAAGGAGLGLTTVRHIVNEAGGEVELETKVGEGTTVRVLLPTENGASA